MSELATHDGRTKRRNGAAHGPVLVSGTKLAGHFGLSRQHVERLAQQNVIERRPGDGLFDQDQSRLKYFAYLRAEHRRSPRTEADSEHTRVKTEMLQLKLMRQRGELVLQADVDALIDTICGCVLTALSGMPARCSRDPIVRRNIELVVHEVRRELAQVCEAQADKHGEPPLDQQDSQYR